MSNTTPPARYCASRYRAVRRLTHEVRIGNIGVGGANPIRIQSMTTSNTRDVDASVRQCIRLAEAGCEIIRLTAPAVADAAALKHIAANFRAAGFAQPLVADIHFLPAAALEAVEHVEKVRINPGNYVDKKHFAARDYTDAEYAAELERVHAAVSPLVLRAKALGRALRIGVNHGSLADRVMNRHGDSPQGMVESAMEFIRICESHGFRDVVLSMKSSNPKVMIAAYRLAAARMAAAGMDYPLHLGVTEAGEGQDARIKSAIGIGALLQDGLGDTLRVSLTEDPWFEVPVAKELAERAEKLWARSNSSGAVSGSDDTHGQDARATALAAEWDAAVDPLQYRRRETATVALAEGIAVNADNPPRVVVPTTLPLSNPAAIVRELRAAHAAQKEIRAEALLISVRSMDDVLLLPEVIVAVRDEVPALFIEIPDDLPILADFFLLVAAATPIPLAFVRRFSPTKEDAAYVLRSWLDLAEKYDVVLAVDADAAAVDAFAHQLKAAPPEQLIYTLSAAATAANAADAGHHALGAYRALAESLHRNGLTSPIWIRNTAANAGVANCADALLDASILSGALFCDGLGDLVSIENAPTFDKSLTLAYDILQGARMRASKTEYVACPSCGRTLFDIQSTTQKIKTRTGHLKGVTIAVMGCIVNGPGEMADADFGYVGGAPGKINLYVRRECVKVGLPQDAAVEHLVGLIKEHGKWVEPPPSNLESK